MWKTRAVYVHEIYDEKDGYTIASNLDVEQAESNVDKHNAELSSNKWEKRIKQSDCQPEV